MSNWYHEENVETKTSTFLQYNKQLGSLFQTKKNNSEFFERVTALRKDGVKVLIAIGGWTDSKGDKYSKMVSFCRQQTISPSRIQFLVQPLHYKRVVKSKKVI